jgi:hypothetical protein
MLVIASNTSGKVKPFGIMSTSAAFKVYSTGRPYYVSTSTAGKLVKTAPSSGFMRKVGYAISKTKLYFWPDSTVVGL